MNKINYVVGNAALCTEGDEKTGLILHVVDNTGAWSGTEIASALDAVSCYPRYIYRRLTRYRSPDCLLGKISACNLYRSGQTRDPMITKFVHVAHLFARDGVHHSFRYGYFHQALEIVSRRYSRSYAIHMPRIKYGVAGNSWDIIENIIQDALVDTGFTVYVYDRPKDSFKDFQDRLEGESNEPYHFTNSE